MPRQVTIEDRRLNGAVYTPAALSDYVAGRAIEFFLRDVLQERTDEATSPVKGHDPSGWRFIDPACGGGELLVGLWVQLVRQLQEDSSRPDILEHLDPRNVLCGVDIDERATRRTQQRIRGLACLRPRDKARCKAVRANALFPFDRQTSRGGWDRLCRRFGAESGFHIVVANPPWGADISAYREKLASGEFSLSQGQFDTSDLFLELALSIAAPGGYIAFIVPDSLFSWERSSLRRMLLTQTRVRLIARLGEKLFDGVNRACAVVICKNAKPCESSRTECVRLTPELRKQILDGRLSFRDADRRLSHTVSQGRLLQNPDCRFDIDVTERDEETLAKFCRLSSTFRDRLVSTRGVELSKHGRVRRCRECGLWSPFPRAPEPACQHCGADVQIGTDSAACIVSRERVEGYARLIVGESVRRYSIGRTWWIALDCRGINYKQADIYSPPKLLLRKTGVGLSAAIDYTPAYTNQVVYIFRQRADRRGIPLEFFLVVMNSRAMYYYLVKAHGETEWRSHPYVTQRQILDLPLPASIHAGGNNGAVVEKIAAAVTPYTTTNRALPPRVDAEVERLVAGVFGLGVADYRAIYTTLDTVQELLPVRMLKRVSISDIFDR